MYESTKVKSIPATERKIVVELVKPNNASDGFSNVNYSGIFTQSPSLVIQLFNSAHKRSRRSNIDGVEWMPTRDLWIVVQKSLNGIFMF